MKTLREYINIVNEASGKWDYASELPSPIPVPGTDYYVMPTLYTWQTTFNPNGPRHIQLTDTVKEHYLLDIDIVDQDQEDVEDMDLERATKLIDAVFPEMIKELGMMNKYDMYKPQLGRITGSGSHYNALATKFIDQT